MKYAVLVLLVIGCVAAFAYLSNRTMPVQEAVDGLARCFDGSTSQAIPEQNCLQSAVETLVDTYPVSTILPSLERSAEEPVAYNCHAIGHVIGKYTYASSPSLEEALSRCSSDCRFACTHAVIGEGVQKILGQEYRGEDIAHADATAIQELGEKYCAESGALCHGIGHVLFINLQNIRDSLNVCDSFSTHASSCYVGVFMEGSGSVDSLGSASSTPSWNDYGYPCRGVLSRHEFACYRYLPEYQKALFARDGVTTQDAQNAIQTKTCDSLSERPASQCYLGLGYNAYRLRDEHDERIDLPAFCGQFRSSLGKSSCVLGVVRSHLSASPVRYPQVLAYCSALGNSAEKELCYYSTFQLAEDFSQWSDSPGDAPPLPRCISGDEECSGYLAQYDTARETLPQYYYGLFGKK